MTNKQQNTIYSPLSVKYALKMLKDGANGETKEQINNLLQNPNLPQYKKIEKILSVANGAFVKEKYKDFVKQSYIDVLKRRYDADLKIDSFESAENINKWVKENTFGEITQILEDDKLKNSDIGMLLINTVAMDMEWKDKFDSTYSGQFKLENGKTITTDMMKNKTYSNEIYYNIDDKTTSLKMDFKEYDGTQLEFIAIMPNEEKLSDYLTKLSLIEIDETIGKMKPAQNAGNNGLIVLMPQFSINYETKLKDTLQELGMKDAFDKNKADFSKMVNKNDKCCRLYANDILHKATIKFTEDGVRATACTSIEAFFATTTMDKKEEPVCVKFDKPFIYIIRDKNNGEIFFMGTVFNPSIK